jgi:TIR domain
MFRVFLSYNTSRDEMVVVWRLQTLAAASGLHLEVLNPEQRSDWATVTKRIDEADSVIAFLTKQATKQVENELRYALSRGKPVIPIVERGVSTKLINELLQQSGLVVFVLDPDNPGFMETMLADYLRKEKLNRETRNAILALAGTIAGLFLLQELTQN